MSRKALKFFFGLLLILMLFGHNFVFNLPQALQDSIMETHSLSTTQFNLLYSLQTIPPLLLSIPLGVLYDSLGPKMLIPSSFIMFIGQLMLLVYTPKGSSFAFIMMIIGRVLQGIGVEIMYMGQGVLANKWMGSMVGLILVMPEVGQMLNAYFSPVINIAYGMAASMGVGLITCAISLLATCIFYLLDKKYDKLTKPSTDTQQPSQEINCSKIKEFEALFWILIMITAINESIYIPFMDNANTMIQKRFNIQYKSTGIYLSIPFGTAMLSTVMFGYFLESTSRRILVLVCGSLGVMAHLLIYILPNSQAPTDHSPYLIALSFVVFGMGLGSYYAIIYPLVGQSVKKQHAGTAYGIVAFVQSLGMSVFPEISAYIIEKSPNQQLGYKNSSLFFLVAGTVGFLACMKLSMMDSPVMNQIGGIEDKQIIYMESRGESELSDMPSQRRGDQEGRQVVALFENQEP